MKLFLLIYYDQNLIKTFKKLKKVLEEKTKEFNKIMIQMIQKYLLIIGLQNLKILDLVVDFIKEKGLKLYGGKASYLITI